MKILIIDKSPERAEILSLGLRDAGYTLVEFLWDMTDLVPRVAAINPDVILIDLENPNRDTVEQMFRVSREVKRPIAMFVNETDAERTKAAMNAGVSAYIVDGLQRERINSIVEVAISRFEAYRELEERAETAETKLSERKTIDRAKSLLMNKRKLAEQDAHDAIRRMARDKGKRMVEVAESILTAEAMGL